MSEIKAIIFDLYGTLLSFNNRSWLHALLGCVRESAASISPNMFREMMVRSYSEDRQMLADLCRAVGVIEPSPNQIARCAEVLNEHISRIFPKEGIMSLLSFLKNRNFQLAVLSNVIQPFTAPVYKYGIEKYLEKIIFSCDVGDVKPSASVYLNLCNALEVDPEECIFIGDSKANDFDAPKSHGMKAVLINDIASEGKSNSGKISEISFLGWRILTGTDPLAPILDIGDAFRLNGRVWTVDSMMPLSDLQQGRYNLLMHISAISDNDIRCEFYAKRYLDTSSIHVESLAYDIMRLAEMNSCEAQIYGDTEKILLMTAVSGVPWDSVQPNDETIYSIGGQCAMAYIIGNADLRPRNTFVHQPDAKRSAKVIDLEHRFFDRALELPKDIDPTDPHGIDSLECEIDVYTKHRVLSASATRRTRRSFLAENDRTQRLARIFRSGWIDAYRKIYDARHLIYEVIQKRLYSDTPLIIGTKAYRRAMARIDLIDIGSRIDENPEDSFDMHY